MPLLQIHLYIPTGFGVATVVLFIVYAIKSIL